MSEIDLSRLAPIQEPDSVDEEREPLEPFLIVAYEEKTNSKVAKEIKALLAQDHTLTVTQLSSEIKVPVEQVSYVLDAYHPSGKQMGVGKGGPWMPEDKATEIIKGS